MFFAQWSEDTRRAKECAEENNPVLQADLVLNKLLTSEGFHTSSCFSFPDYLWVLAAVAFETICLSVCAEAEHSSGTRPAVTKMTSLFHL